MHPARCLGSLRARLAVIGVAIVLALYLSGLQPAYPVRAQKPTGATARGTRERAARWIEKMPLYFIENRGQMNRQVAYSVHGRDKSLYFTPQGITFALTEPRHRSGERPEALPASPRPAKIVPIGRETRSAGVKAGRRWVLKLDFLGANPRAHPEGEAPTTAVMSYFQGPRDHWQTGVATYRRIRYRDLWPGIDMVYEGTVDRLKYCFELQPGADPKQIRLAYRGATMVELSAEGKLAVSTPAGGFEDEKPVAYQAVNGRQVTIPSAYQLVPDAEQSAAKTQGYGFVVGSYDRDQPLVIDPAMLIYCGYLGGASTDQATSIAVDRDGNAYVTGLTYSSQTSFPTTVGPDLTYNDATAGDAFIIKLRADGSGIVYGGYLGGSSADIAGSIAVDSEGNAYVTGLTASSQSSFPVTVGPDLTLNGSFDAFVAKVRSDGTALAYCGYLGGTAIDQGSSIAVDSAGSAYVTGFTGSGPASFPVAVGPSLINNGGSPSGDAFVAKVRADGTGLAYCGYVGGSGADEGAGIAVDSAGNAYITGVTRSSETSFPVTVGPGRTFSGVSDGFVAKVTADGAGLAYCGYLGGAGSDQGSGIAVDGSGNAYVTGSTASDPATFPVILGPSLAYGGGTDAFVAAVSPDGTALLYCGYLGGSNQDNGFGIAVDDRGNAYVAGATASTETSFPVAGGPSLTYSGGSTDAFVAKVKTNGTGLVYAGYLGGAGADVGFGIAVGSERNAHVSGYTASGQTTFPVTVGPGLTYSGGNADAFVAKIAAVPESTGAP